MGMYFSFSEVQIVIQWSFNDLRMRFIIQQPTIISLSTEKPLKYAVRSIWSGLGQTKGK